MARVTKHLGLGATLSTTFHHPYHLARLLASLDLLSNGRACWNVVTSTTDFEARNFGMKDLPAKDLRYDRGDEVGEACCALWDCWEEGGLSQSPDRRRALVGDALGHAGRRHPKAARREGVRRGRRPPGPWRFRRPPLSGHESREDQLRRGRAAAAQHGGRLARDD